MQLVEKLMVDRGESPLVGAVAVYAHGAQAVFEVVGQFPELFGTQLLQAVGEGPGVLVVVRLLHRCCYSAHFEFARV